VDPAGGAHYRLGRTRRTTSPDPTSAIPITAASQTSRPVRGRVADEAGSADVDELAVAVPVAAVVAVLVTEDVVVEPELEPVLLVLLVLEDVDGAELAGDDELVVGGGCE